MYIKLQVICDVQAGADADAKTLSCYEWQRDKWKCNKQCIKAQQ